ncbi:MAG: DnaB-like helicase N-terminal domain-containing protein, partial [bacterium]|nr:DnaB-like helicase N-terminal domain-containing protein [bacterium]
MALEQNTKTIKDKLPPQNVEAEQSVLGALLIDNEAIIKVADFLVFDDFYRPVHQKIYATMLELYQRHEPIDILNLTNRLKEKNLLQDIGGTTYLSSLANLVPTASHVVSYAKIIQQKRILRDLISASYNIAELGYQEERDMEEVL